MSDPLQGASRQELIQRIYNLRRQRDDMESQLKRQRRKVRKLGGTDRNVRPENLVWVFGSGRTGSTWLARMLGENTKAGEEAKAGQRRHGFWEEPWVGFLFNIAEEWKRQGRGGKGFILAPHFRETWLGSVRGMVLDGAAVRFPDYGPDDVLVVKEPHGSEGAPLLVEALPESRMVILLRDPRDIVASQADAHDEGGFMPDAGEGPGASSAERAALEARRYMKNVLGARRAYESHRGRKVLLRYEDLRADTLGTMERIRSALELPFGDDELARSVEKWSWENIPEGEKGSGKKFRKATPGGWREDLTPEQVRIVEKVARPILEEFYG